MGITDEIYMNMTNGQKNVWNGHTDNCFLRVRWILIYGKTERIMDRKQTDIAT